MKAKFLYLILIITVFIGCNTANERLPLNLAENNAKTDSTHLNTVENSIKYSLEQLDNTKGLSNSSINCIFQDSQNLLWIGTWDGLNRYDGTNFKIFRPEPDNKNSLSNQVVLKISEDNSGYIWILTMHGINRYNKKTDTFQRFYFSRNNTTPLSESQFNMTLDESKQVFCAVKGWGIGYFDGMKFHMLSNGFADKTVKKLEFSTSGELFVLLDDNKLYSLSVKNSENKKIISGSKLVSDGIQTFGVLPNKNIVTVSTNGEAAILSIASKNKKNLPEKNIENIIGSIKEGLVLSGKSGYFIVDAVGKHIMLPWSKYLKNQKITTLVQGSENVIWTGTDGDGVFKMYPLKKSFNLVSKAQIPKLDAGIVRAFLKAGKNSFWIGTKGNGLFTCSADFYLDQEKPIAYKNFNENNSSINNSVFALSKGNENLIFIGTDGEGITVYDLEKSKLISWREIIGSKNYDYFKSVYTIYQDAKGFIWLGTNGYGMICCKIIRSGEKLKITDFKKYTANAGGSTALSSNIIFSIVPRNDDQLWIGTRLGGLNLFNKQTEVFTTYKNKADDLNSLSSNDILCLATDSRNRLWVGTSFGLNLLQNFKDGEASFRNFTVKDGLPNNTIHGIVPVNESNLWISTNFGLSNFAVNTSKFTNYSQNEGLQNNEFSDGAFYSDPESGFIFMGGIKGFNYFLPQKIKESSVIPNLFIDKISGQNQSVPYYQSLVISSDAESYPSLILKHDQNFFDIHLAALTYTNNEKCQYSYQLKGFDKDWNNIDNRKIISFTNVPRGKYSLWLKWSNSDGVWSRPVHAANITIKPVWWQSNTAIIIYLVLGLFFILFVRSYYLKRQSLKQNLLFIKNEEELHENRLTFFTNIAHEFLTPLTLIAGPVQKMAETRSLDPKNRKFINMIQKNTSRLLFLTQQLLEFRKAEYDYLEVTVKNFDLVNLIEQIAELFDDWALDKNIDYSLDVSSELPGWFDKDKLEKIIFNLMSNAFKYTPKNGKIYLKCRIVEDEGVQKLNFSITNTGKGIPKEKLDSLFDRFFLSDTNQTSDTELFRTGIGLAFIKKLITVLRGDILVSSIPDAETTFTVLIPCEKEAFTEKEIDKEIASVLISHHFKNILEEIEENPGVVPEKISALEIVENNRKKILIVEDEKEIHLFLNDLLADKYQVISTYNGIEALEVMEKELPDIIISDVMMPLMDGVELCQKVKTNIRTCHIPFIMLTAKNSVVHRIEGLEKGANSYIPKPFYPDHLLVRVQKLLEEKELILQHFTQDAVIGDLSEVPVNNEEKVFIKQIIDLIRKNIDNENLNSAFIEKTLGISNSQLYRKIKEIFGLSTGDLIRTIRLKYSAELLRKNELTVSEVCYQSGFNNRSYFYREFKKVYNTTPKNYQLQYKLKSSLFSSN
ncbi:two-component regulator propeller domain-containing protein [Flavobacterium sp. NRK1]|uniref:two-component regulator propeller domain-containing protein n=1 Tax=Flavobacterium sp. NRK1 TaxID=2954929 RepID=UPI00209370CA|nr:two-component regulator propeller domain-containing protein [Flavobacterium sp. NRK1]MCO6149221.1 response regulator [Flavobacterium sp. NRK1]